MRKTLFMMLLGWYFILNTRPAVEIGPFKTKEACERIANQAGSLMVIAGCYER